MGLYDVIDEISKGSVTKTETGDVRIYGVLVGQVVNNYHKDFPGRVCVKIPVRGAKTNTADTLKWARVASFYMGKKWGEYFLPEVGDEVLLVFEQGNIEKPYVIGAIPSDSSDVLKKSANEKNTIKTIQTMHGSRITFTDNSEDTDGGKDSILIETAKSGHSVLLDNEKKQIEIKNKSNDSHLLMKTEDGTIEAKTTSKMTLAVGDNCKVVLDGNMGKITISAKSIVLESKETNIDINSSGNLNLQGQGAANVKCNMLKVDSSGPVSIGGASIKLGS